MNSSAQINLQNDTPFLLECGVDIYAYLKTITDDYPIQNIKFLNTKTLSNDIASLIPLDSNDVDQEQNSLETNFNYFSILQELNSAEAPSKWILIDCNKIHFPGLCDLFFNAFKALKADFDITIPSCQPNGDVCLFGFGKNVSVPKHHDSALDKSNKAINILQKMVKIIMLFNQPDFNLTPRELECIDWVAKGKTSGEIGSILAITESTVDKHVAAVCRKLDTVNRMQMIARAVRLGLI